MIYLRVTAHPEATDCTVEYQPGTVVNDHRVKPTVRITFCNNDGGYDPGLNVFLSCSDAIRVANMILTAALQHSDGEPQSEENS